MFCALICLITTYHGDDILRGALFAFFGGASGSVYSIYSKQIGVKFSTLEILSLRFYLTIFIALVLNLYWNDFTLMHLNYYLIFMALALCSVIMPLVLFQVGIKHLSLEKALSLMPLAPLLCYGCNLCMSTTSFHILRIGIITLISILIIL